MGKARRGDILHCSRVNGCPINITFIKSSCEWQPHTQVCVGQPLELPVLATGSWPPRKGSLSHSLAGHQAAWGHRRLKGVQAPRSVLPQVSWQSCSGKGVWSRFRNNRWSTSRDWFWRRALPNPSVRNSRSYFFPLKWTWQPSLHCLAPFFGQFSYAMEDKGTDDF